MGLLDALNGGGDANGGLLSFLQSLTQPQPQGQTGPLSPDMMTPFGGNGSPATGQAPIFTQAPMSPVQPQANSAPSPLDSAQWPSGPIGAPSQANAQMPPAQPPAVVPAQPAPDATPQGPGFLDRLNTGLQSLGHGGSIIGALTGNLTDPTSIAKAQQTQTANVTAKALLAKGVDPQVVAAAVAPGNTELLKALVTQNFGPQTKTSIGEGYVTDKNGNITRAYTPDKTPMSIGSGYIYDPKTKQTIRAYEPEDKIPAGFVKGDDGNMHFIPGGPADPAYLRLAEAQKKDPNGNYVLGRGGEVVKNNPDGSITVLHKNEAEAPEATLDEHTTKAMASQYLAGDKSVMQNLGRGAQGAANIVKLRTEIYSQANAAGLNGKDIVNNFNEQAGNLAGQRSIGTRSANISLAANEANNMIPIALEASAKVPRGEWMPWNKMVQAYQTGTSSPELARFVAATNSLVNSYVRAVSPSGVPTDSMREHAYSMLNSAQSQKAYEAVTSIMQDEMKAAMAAPGQVRKELRHDDDAAKEPAKPAIDQGAVEAEMKRRGLLK